MANIKISQLPAKGTNLGSSDLLEVSEFTGTGYVSKSITGQEIIDAAGGGGGGGLQGVHSIVPLNSGEYTLNQVVSGSSSNGSVLSNFINAHAYIPNQRYFCDELSLYINTGVVGGLGRIGIYDDNNGSPNNLIFESSDIDCSTSGYKSIVSDIDFVAGQIYWIAHFWNAAITMRVLATQNFIIINTPSLTSTSRYTYGLSYTFGTGFPNPMTGQLPSANSTTPLINMKKA